MIRELRFINTLNLLSDARLLNYALKIDIEFSETARLKGCPECGSQLHFARYQRKGQFLNLNLPSDWNLFHSLCCASDTCRKRVRPLSIRFAGRSPFSSNLVLLAKLLQSGGSQRSVIALSKELLVSERTIRRWLRFWSHTHIKSTWWRKIASVWSLSGKTICDLWNLLQVNKKIKENPIEYLLSKSAELWSEIKLSVGRDFPAEDA